MSDDRLHRLSKIVVLLHEKSQEGRVPWRLEGDEEKHLVARIGANSIRIEVARYRKNGAPASDIQVTFLNADGDVTDIVRDTSLGDIPPPAKHFGWHTYMQEIIDIAERQALGSDRVLDEIVSELMKDPSEDEAGVEPESGDEDDAGPETGTDASEQAE
jgi:hypothetical protein